MQTNMSLISASAMLLLGAVLIWRGIRGRRIDDHPICRACGFDLFGLPPESHRCSECGVDLHKHKAIRIGHRQPARGVMILGLFLFLAGGSWLGIASKAAFKQLDVNQHKPVWWLLSNAGSSTVQTRDVALKELLRRLKNNSLSKPQVQRVAQRALEVQADKNKPWTTAWGDFVESAQKAGVLPSEQWQQYLKQALTAYSFEARSKVRRGACLPLQLTRSSGRVGTVMPIHVEFWARHLQVSGITWDRSERGHDVGSGRLGGAGVHRWQIRADDPVFAKLQNGPQTVRLSASVKVYCGSTFLGFARTSGTPAYQTQLDFEAKWKLVSEPTVKGITDESLRPAVQKSLQLRVNKQTGFSWPPPPPRPDLRAIMVMCHKPPVDMAFDVLVRQGDKEWKLGRVAFKAGEFGGQGASADIPNLTGNKVDIILRPNLQLAEEWWVNYTEIWNDEIIFRDFQLQDSSTTRKSR